MVVDVVRCQRSGDNLQQVLHIPATEVEEATHQALVAAREKVDRRTQAASMKAHLQREQPLANDTRLPIEEMKERIRNNLQVLEQEQVLSARNNYQDLVSLIAQDVRNQRKYRQRRRQEMQRLRSTLKSLAAKRTFFEEQVDYYNQYVKTCIENLATRTGK